MSKRRLRPDEQRAWARVARRVTPLPGKTLAPETAETEESAPSSKRPPSRPAASAAQKSAPAYPAPLAPLPDRSGERRIRRGQASIAGRLDLHGHTQVSAADALRSFLVQHRAEGARCVLVITGKGRDGDGVLRRRFLQWLDSSEARAIASGYAPAHRKHGGGGAWYVFLRRL